MRWHREPYIELMTFGHVDRPMFVELFGPLIGLDEEWRAQGASEDQVNMTAFDWDYVPRVQAGGNCGVRGGAPSVVVEDTDEYVIRRDYLGRTTKLCKATATIPLPLDFPVKTADDWEQKKHLFEFSEDRIDDAQIEKATALQKEGHMVVISIPGGWNTVRELMGEEEACISYYTQPELMHDIMNTIKSTSTRVLERITEKIKVDQLFVHEDMAGKSGPLIGPDTIREFIAPHYRACWEIVSSRGTPLFNQDSDGFMMPVIEAFLECGINVMHPCEPAAGMDIVEIRKKYGKRLAVLGGIDKHVLRQSKADIGRELEYKLQPLMQGGGTVFGLDHRIPNGTPLDNYCYYVKRGRQLLGLPPLDPDARGWGRMAG